MTTDNQWRPVFTYNLYIEVNIIFLINRKKNENKIAQPNSKKSLQIARYVSYQSKNRYIRDKSLQMATLLRSSAGRRMPTF